MAEDHSVRLRLVPCEPAHLRALLESADLFQQESGMSIVETARGLLAMASPEHLEKIRQAQDADVWQFGCFVLHVELNLIIGLAGFKGRPDAEGMVEIGYGIVPEHEGRGYATETAQLLCEQTADEPLVKRLRAHALPEMNASTRILTKCGFTNVGEVVDPEDGPVWR